ncbi:MAG TPA: hypothetical protein VH109_04485, partial [Steroidobacteraceae bacterium]|nr:hypothetical protein [Steroidobacteraceae bacterium]
MPSLQVTIAVPLPVLAAALLVVAAVAVAGAAAGALAPEPADLLTPPCPLQAPRPPLEDVPSLQVTVAVPLPVLVAALVLAAGATAGAAAAPLAPEPADLLTPPCPLQAPRPPLDELPSLQVTLEPLLLELVLAGAAALEEPEALVLVVLVADLLTPPCPLQAPRPPLDVLPSLQVTVALVSWAAQIAGAANSVPANKTPSVRPLMFFTFI